MACWGLAYSDGPNYSKQWGILNRRRLKQTWSPTIVLPGSSARDLMSSLLSSTKADSVEQALILLIGERYPVNHIAQDYDAINQAL